MLIHYPHYLCGIHSRTASECYYYIRLKSCHRLHTFSCTLKCRVRSYIKEAGISYAHFIKLLCNNICISVLIKECISYNKCFLLMHYISKLIKCYRQTASLEIYLFRSSKPQHVLSPLCYSFYIYKMLNTYIL